MCLSVEALVYIYFGTCCAYLIDFILQPQLTPHETTIIKEEVDLDVDYSANSSEHSEDYSTNLSEHSRDDIHVEFEVFKT